MSNTLTKPLNEYIDHTLLKPQATHEEFQMFLDEAVKYNFASVCVSPYMALPVKEAMKDYPHIKICTVVGFPHGNVPSILKAAEAEYFASQGIDEIDFVINYGLLKTGHFEDVGAELEAMNRILKTHGTVFKCIIETCYLTEDEKNFMYKALEERTNIDYIKTSTGFGTDGANLGDVLNWNCKRARFDARKAQDLIILHDLETPSHRETGLKIKAAGGIRDLDTALRFIAAGADRLGMSASVKVMEAYNDQPYRS